MQDTGPDETEAKITTKWKNPPEVKDLKQDLLDAKQAHDDQVSKITVWLDHLHVRGSAAIKKIPGRSQVQPKLIRKQAEWRYPSLSEPFLASKNIFNVDPSTWEDTEAARQNGLVLHNQFNTKIKKVKFVDEYIRAAVDEGTAIVKLGWDYLDEEYEEEEEVYQFMPDPNMGQLMQELDAMQADNPTGYGAEVPEELQQAHDMYQQDGTPYQPVPTGETEKVKKIRVLCNKPTLEVCDYHNVVIDPSAKGDMEKARFIIHSFETSLAELRQDKKYSNLDKINVEGNSPLGQGDYDTGTAPNGNFNFSDEPRKRIVAHEYWGYWDTDGTGVVTPIVATWVGDTLIRMEETPFPDKELPFVVVPMLPVKNSAYGEPDGELLKDNQKIIGAITRGMIDVMGRSANGQMGVRKDALDAINRRRFENGQDYQYNGNVDPRMAFYMHQYSEIPQSAQYMLDLQNHEAESMSGVKAFAGGINSGALGDVATGIRGALDSVGKRETAILRRLADGMIQIARKIISMNAEFLEDEEIIRITNENFVAVRRDDLKGNFDLSMSISTAEEDNIKAQELAFMLQTVGPNTDFGFIKIILRDIARLRKMPELADKIEKYEPQPDPIAQQKAELEVALLQAQIAKVQAETEENIAEAALDNARARKEHSSADKQDLDFIEQESGVTQERQKEIVGEQARSNMARDVQKAAMDKSSADADYKRTALEKYLGKTK